MRCILIILIFVLGIKSIVSQIKVDTIFSFSNDSNMKFVSKIITSNNNFIIKEVKYYGNTKKIIEESNFYNNKNETKLYYPLSNSLFKTIVEYPTKKLKKESFFYVNGKLKKIINYKSNFISGKCYLYDSLGNNIIEATYKDNSLNGKLKLFDISNKKVILIVKFDKNIPHSIYIKRKKQLDSKELNEPIINNSIFQVYHKKDFDNKKYKIHLRVNDSLAAILNFKKYGKLNGDYYQYFYYLGDYYKDIFQFYNFPVCSYILKNGNLISSYHFKLKNIGYYKGTNKIKHEGYWSVFGKDSVSKTYYLNGQLKSISNFEKGKRMGLSVLFDSVGNILSQINYKDNLKEGEFLYFFKNQGIVKGFYVNGNVTGTLSLIDTSNKPLDGSFNLITEYVKINGTFKNGIPLNSLDLNDDFNHIKLKLKFENGKIHGDILKFDFNTETYYTVKYKDGKCFTD